MKYNNSSFGFTDEEIKILENYNREIINNDLIEADFNESIFQD